MQAAAGRAAEEKTGMLQRAARFPVTAPPAAEAFPVQTVPEAETAGEMLRCLILFSVSVFPRGRRWTLL